MADTMNPLAVSAASAFTGSAVQFTAAMNPLAASAATGFAGLGLAVSAWNISAQAELVTSAQGIALTINNLNTSIPPLDLVLDGLQVMLHLAPVATGSLRVPQLGAGAPLAVSTENLGTAG